MLKKSDHLVALMHILDAELSVGCATIIVLYDRVADIYRIASLDVIEEISHIECNGRNMMVWMRLLDEFELQMAALRTDLSSHSIVIDIFCEEDRS